MKLTEDEKLLYDSCGDFVKRFLLEKRMHKNCINCIGDNNILELCTRCPYYNPFTDLMRLILSQNKRLL